MEHVQFFGTHSNIWTNIKQFLKKIHHFNETTLRYEIKKKTEKVNN